MRLASGGKVRAAAIVLVILLAACDHDASTDGTPAAKSRAHTVPAARELYNALSETNARSVDVLDWGYKPCGTGTTMLSYSISMRLFAFAPSQNTHFGAYRQVVVRMVRAAGWTLRRRLSTRRVTLPTVPSAYYRLSRQEGNVKLTGLLSLAGDVNPLVGVGGILTIDGPCVDADGAAGTLQSHNGSPPFAAPSPSASHS